MLLERLRKATRQPPGSKRTASLWAGWGQHAAIGTAAERGAATRLNGPAPAVPEVQVNVLDGGSAQRRVLRHVERLLPLGGGHLSRDNPGG